MKVEEIRQKLLDRGVPQDIVTTTKGKGNLMELAQKSNVVLEEEILEIIEETVEDEEQEEKETEIGYLDPKWPDYVLSHFTKVELTEGLPNISGLRRVTELLLGPIVRSYPVSYTKGEGCSCSYLVEILWKRTDEGYLGGETHRTFGGLAGSSEFNTDPKFKKYPEAIAETRAEVRALRKALRLPIAAEELQDNQESYEAISTLQEKCIASLCERREIVLDKFVDYIGETNLKNVTKNKATELIKMLNEMKNVPAELKAN